MTKGVEIVEKRGVLAPKQLFLLVFALLWASELLGGRVSHINQYL